MPCPRESRLPAQTLRIFANGVAVGEYRLQAAQTLSVDLPASGQGVDGFVMLLGR